MTSLTGINVYLSYGDILTTTNSGQGLSATLEPVQDGLGNSSSMEIALNAINFIRTGGNTLQLDSVSLTAGASDINSVAKSNPILPGTGGVILPSGTTAQRLAPPVNGTMRYNTQLNALEAYQNGTWGNLQAGAVMGPGASVTNNIAIFADTSGLLLADSGVNISTVTSVLTGLGYPMATDIQISGVDILNFGSGAPGDVGVIFRQTDYVLGIFPNTIASKFPNIVLGFANPSSTDSAFELTEGALLLSRLSTAQRNLLVPIDGMMIYNITTEAFNFYQNGTWADLATGAVLSVTGTANQIVATGTSSVVLSIADNPTLPGLEDVLIPSGTTAQRPTIPVNGMIRYNTTDNVFEGFQNGVWANFGSGGGSVTSITAGTNLTGGTITTTGTIALSATPTGLTSLGVGNLSLSANQIISTDVNGNISLLPNGTGLVQLGAFPVTINSTGTVIGNVVDFPTGIIDTLTSQEIDIVAVGGNPGPLRLYDANNSNFVAILAPVIVPSNYGWTWPATDGTNGQVLTTDGAGTLSWSAGSVANAKYIVQTTDAGLPNAQALDLLGPGLLKINASGVVQLAIPDVDYATLTTLTIYLGLAEAAADEATASALSAASSEGAAAAFATAAAASAAAAAVSAGVLVGATSGKFILKQSNVLFPNAQSIGDLTNGVLTNTVLTGEGTLSIATQIIDTGLNGNIFLGTPAGNGTLTGTLNIGIGYQSLNVLTTGSSNTFVGYQSAKNITTGLRNTGIGTSVLLTNVTGNDNSAFGYNVLTLATGGPNSGFGSEALGAITTGVRNTAFGFNSILTNSTANDLTAFGHNTLKLATASPNSAFGSSSLAALTTGTQNSAFGYNSLTALTTGTQCSAFGSSSLAAMTTGGPCSAFGYNTLAVNTANNNAAFGANSLAANTTGTRNTALGINAAITNTTSNDITAVGYNALTLSTVSENSAFGSGALAALTTGTNCSAFGFNSILTNSTANDLTAFGHNALKLATAGSNSAFGSGALAALTTGTNCSAFGMGALGVNTANNNSAFGEDSLGANTTGIRNSAFGRNALGTNITGSNNAALGYNAGQSQVTYTECTFIGSNADASVNALTNAIAIGYNSSVATSNSLVLGNGANVGIGTSSPTRSLTVIGGQIVNVVESATNYTVLNSDYITGITSTAAPRTVTLPTAASANKGQIYVVKDQSGGAATNNITVNVNGGGNIDGAATKVINTNYGAFSFYSNGTQWYVW
jgi:hypothetical protein